MIPQPNYKNSRKIRLKEISLRNILSFILITLAVLNSWGASVRLSVSPGRGHRDIAVGDMFYITYEVSDCEQGAEKPSDVPGAKVMYFERTGQSSRFSSVNGKVSQSYSYTYTCTLKAEKEGSYTFGPVSIGGVKSNVVRYEILEKRKDSPAPQESIPGNRKGTPNSAVDDNKPKYIGKGDGNLYLRAEVSHSSAYPQEALVYTVKLYTTYDAIKFIGATAAPKFEGFVVEESKDVSNSLQYETVNGKTYATAIIARYIIFPQMEGQLKVKGNTYTVSVDEREYYHDPFWGNMSVSKPLQLNVTPNDLSINVKPLPKPVPPDFSGGVGQFKLSSTLPSESFLSNAASSIVYTISGSGNLKYVSMPDLAKLFPPQLEVYTPTSDIEVNVGKTNVSGKVTYDYSFMPLESGRFHIPEVKLVYFNPLSGKYETTSTRGYDINVGHGQGSANSQTRANLAFDSSLMKIKNNLKPEIVPLVETFWFWFIFYIIPFFVFCSILVYYRQYVKSHADIIAVRSRKASKVAKKRLKRAAQLMKKGETEKFYDVLLESMWGYLGDKLKMPTSELNRANVKEAFDAKGLDEKVASQMIEIVDDCEFYKYASSGASRDMKDVYDLAVEVIDEIEKSIK